MDLSEYASQIGIKAIYLIANIILDILLKLAKDYKNHLENLEMKGEKPYLTRRINKLQAWINKREINKIDLENSNLKFELKTLDGKLSKQDNLIRGYELQQEKLKIEDKITQGYEIIDELTKENKLDEISKVETAIGEYENRIKEIDSELDQMNVGKAISPEKYKEAQELRENIISEKTEKQELLDRNLERKSELKTDIENLMSKKISKNTPKDLHRQKKELQEELDVINRKLNKDKNVIVNNEKNQEQEEKETHSQQDIKDIKKDVEEKINKEQENKEREIKNTKEEKKDEKIDEAIVGTVIELEGAKAISNMQALKGTKEEIKDTFIKLKKLAIDNPDLKNNPEYKEKIQKAEKLMEKYDLFGEKSKDENVKMRVNDMVR